MTTALARPSRLTLEAFARAARLHPELVVQFARLGLLEVNVDAGGKPFFDSCDLVRVARIQRLRTGLSLNYAALGLVLDLLDRIDLLESQQRKGN